MLETFQPGATAILAFSLSYGSGERRFSSLHHRDSVLDLPVLLRIQISFAVSPPRSFRIMRTVHYCCRLLYGPTAQVIHPRS